MAKKKQPKDDANMSREERATGKAPASDMPAGLDPDSREAHVKSGK